MFPTIEEVLEKEIKSAEYCWGKPLPAEGWRDVALGMRDWARKLDDMRQGAASWNATLLKLGREMEDDAVRMHKELIRLRAGLSKDLGAPRELLCLPECRFSALPNTKMTNSHHEQK